MKKFILKNKVLLISILILIIWATSQLLLAYKEGMISNDPIIFYYHIISDLNLWYIQILASLFVFIPAIWDFHKELSTKSIKNQLTRVEYKRYLKKHYMSALKKALILPIFTVFLFICCAFFTKGFNIGSNMELYGWVASPNPKFLQYISIFFLIYIINLFLHSIFYINIGLSYCKKYSNIIVVIILTYLTIIVVDIFTEIFFANILLSKVFGLNNMSYYFNLFNIWTYTYIENLFITVLFSILLVVISFIILYLKYKDKEGVMIEIEK